LRDEKENTGACQNKNKTPLHSLARSAREWRVSMRMDEEDDEEFPELFPAQQVLALGELKKLSLGKMEECWRLVGDIERDSTLRFAFYAYGPRAVLGQTRGYDYSYDVHWFDEHFPARENERFPTLQIGYPRTVYEQYADETPRVRLFMTLICCYERWNAGYCEIQEKLTF
jgi:hypothetical protein